MPRFQYQAQTRGGERVSGIIHAEDDRAAAKALRDDDLYPVRITKAGASGWGSSISHHLLPVAAAHLAQFFTQLASLLRTGITPHDSLDELSALTSSRRLGRVAREIGQQAAEGGSLAEQFARYPAIFDRHVAGLVAAGEQLGALPEMLQELADQYEARARLHGRLKWLRLYYGGVLVLALLVAPFPWMVSRGIGWYAGVLLTRLLPILAGLVALFFVLRALNAIPAFANLRSRVGLAIPVFGSMGRWAAVARFLHTLNLAQRSGVTFHQALDLAGEAAGAPGIRDGAAEAARRVRTGMPLDEAVGKMRFLPKRVRQMIAGAERTGELERRLGAAADHAIERRDAAINTISTGAAAAALAGSGVVVLIALVFAWRNLYAALFERAGLQ